MMRILTISALSLGLALASCSKEPKVDEAQLNQFEPPQVGVRGDVVPRQQARFERLDANHDGFVSADEFPARRAARFKELDGNKDGKVSRSEMVEGGLDRFDSLDANKDQQVTPDERPDNSAAPGNSAN